MRHQRTVLWRGLDTFSAEYCGLWRADDGWRLEGTILLVLDGRPALVRYCVECDAGWTTRAAEVTLQAGEQTRVLRLAADDRQRWSVDGRPRPDLCGCPDVDLSITPATNLLPIRRLGLAVGESADARAAWVLFPALTVEVLAQRYTRLAERQYRYETASGYGNRLDVDDLGLVTHYPGGWARVAEEGVARGQE